MYYFSVYILKTNQRTLLCLKKKTPPRSGKASAKIKTQKEINKKIKQKNEPDKDYKIEYWYKSRKRKTEKEKYFILIHISKYTYS